MTVPRLGPRLGRPLGTFERAQWLSDGYAPLNAVAVLALTAGPSPEVLARSLALLQERHPLLSARIVEDRGGPRFEAGGAPPPALEILERTGDGDWTGVVEREVNRRVDAGQGPPLRCTYLAAREGRGRSEVVLTFHHAFMDGASGLHLLRELLTLCGEATAGSAGSSTVVPALSRLQSTGETAAAPVLPPPAEDRFPAANRGLSGLARFAAFLARQGAAEAAYRFSRHGRRRPAARASRGRVFSWDLPEEPTHALVRRCRRERVTVASALHAALLQAVDRRLHGGSGPRMRFLTFADLRPYLRPPVPPERLGSYFSMLGFTLRPAGDFWSLAHRLHQRVHTATRRGEKFLAARAAVHMLRPTFRLGCLRMGDTALSYTGPVPPFPRSGEIEVLGLRTFVSNFNLGPEYTAQVRLWQRRLQWDVLYLDGDMDRAGAEAVAEEIRGILEAAAG